VVTEADSVAPAVADLDAFDRLDAHEGLREASVELAVPLNMGAEAGGDARREDLEDAAECIAGVRGLADRVFHA